LPAVDRVASTATGEWQERAVVASSRRQDARTLFARRRGLTHPSFRRVPRRQGSFEAR
jgi:hypothetical protein